MSVSTKMFLVFLFLQFLGGAYITSKAPDIAQAMSQAVQARIMP